MSYGMLVDPRAESEGAPRLELPAGTSLDDAAEALGRVLAAHELLDRVLLVVGDEEAGATSRSYARIVLGITPRGPGDEARATVPGESTRFSVIAFRCASCGSRAYTAFYDDRYRPVCRTGDHGPMELG
ncbi:hypothetical protein OG264_04120 [Streptomyces xanthophaeus]|uniref:hypothetical protein n=1 Tax=Streptomyces xanthophaeus TaxID=67385 RepID=UPI0038700069|nr:hypothetical protein OG264_04120 [Streptomyces xanthophaeus]WST65501.1 hypothetical protein OG605_34240 [Streptomyces xanthophaeus]